ncbi:MAG: molybdenum cofactor guanylyltransferase [Elusimicrobiota bacterium]
MIDNATGVILAGGRSTRFGSNKALAPWRSTTLIETTLNTLLQVLPRAMIVTKDVETLSFLRSARTTLVRDIVDGHRPLAGLHTALEGLTTTHAFVCACDMPLIQTRLIEALWNARENFDAVIPVWRGARQPLFGLYSKSCAEPVRRAIAAGEHGIYQLFDSLHTRVFLEEESLAVDPRGLSFHDVDTRADYEALQLAGDS